MDKLPRIWVITGLMAAGKSTVAQALAELLTPSVHLRGDVFRKMIVNGRAEMSPTPSTEALEQLSLRYRLACDAAASYAQAGFTVVIRT
jgi:predicted kinase